MKRGFTLVELLATVTLLGILIAIAYPKVVEQVNKEEEKITSSKKELIYSGTNDYMNQNENDYPIRKGKVYCIPLSTLIDNNFVAVDVSDIDMSLVVKVSITDTKNYDLVKSDKCTSS